MESAIRDRYSDVILEEALRRYAIASHQIRALEGTENFVYAFERADGHSILRIGHSLRRSAGLVEAEIAWVNHLAAAGVSVAPATLSAAGRHVEAIDDLQGGQFLVTAFHKAQGQPPHGLWTPALYTALGQLLGQMHALAEDYRPLQPSWRRPTWDDPVIDVVTRHLPPSEGVIQAKYQALCEHLRTLPADKRCYGLVHFDVNGGNMLVDDKGRLTLFDFDECCYSWYANDIAIALFSLSMDAPDRAAFTRVFMPHFLRGYRTAYTLNPCWLRELPVFLKMAEIFVYAVIHRDSDVSNVSEGWGARFMLNRKEKLEGDVPYIDLDFEAFAVEL